MKVFETSDFKTEEKNINQIIKQINDLIKPFDKPLMKIIEGKSLLQIDLADVPQALKNDKVESSASFKEMLSFGVDIRDKVVLSDKELNDITALESFISSSEGKYLQCIQINKGKAVISEIGINHLESKKIKFNKTELELFNKINSVIDFIINDVSGDHHLLYEIFNNKLLIPNIHQKEIYLKDFNGIMKKFKVDKK